jgi:uncharacterized RDD family membrane protein YckC
MSGAGTGEQGVVEEAPRGFVSAEAKGGIVKKAAVIGGIVVFLQFAIPVVITVYVMITSGLAELSQIDPDRGAWWKDGLWLVETSTGRSGWRSDARLMRWDGAGEELVEMATFKARDPRLLPAGDTLWIVSPDVVGTLSSTGIEFKGASEWLGLVSPPFLDEGRPALVIESPEGRELRRFRDGTWHPGGALDLGAAAGFADLGGMLVVGDPGAETIVTFIDGQLQASPEGSRCIWGGACADRWQPILDETEQVASYSAASIDGHPVVFVTIAQGIDAEVTGLRRGDDGWQRFIELEFGIPGAIGLVPTDKPGRYFVLVQGLPGSVTAWEIVGDQVRRKLKLGDEMAPPASMMIASYGATVLGWLLAFLMGLALAPSMRRGKVTEHRSRDRVKSYASLVRRGLATGVDTLISGGPMIVAWVMFMGIFTDYEGSPLAGMLDAAGVLAIGIIWGLLCFFVFSYVEGRTGQTPGKWLLGIRALNLELEPCGFGRALLRNVLMVADGMFSCVVGVFMIALTASWQRIGDLAGRTVVVLDGPTDR